jgi:hypothetical protein
MPGRTIDFDTVRKIGLALHGVEDSTAYRSPALKVRGKLLGITLREPKPPMPYCGKSILTT